METTEYTYDGGGHMLMLMLTAQLTGGGAQTTQWGYGVSTPTGSDIVN